MNISKVLVASDDPAYRIALEGVLQKEGFIPVCVPDGRSALQTIVQARENNSHFALYILDYSMRFIDARKLITFTIGLVKMPPVILVSSSPLSILDYMDLPEIHLLEKPFSGQALLEKMSEALNQSKNSLKH